MTESSPIIIGDILLHQGAGVLPRLIRFFDGSQYSHSSLLIKEAAICEADGLKGVVETDLDKAIKGSNFVDTYRLKLKSDKLSLVAEKGEDYVNQGDRYAYEQIVLLALLCITRKIPLAKPLKWLLRVLLDKAASILLKTSSGGRQPMICSELVYRCFNEAIATTDEDELTLHINTFPFSLGITSRSLLGGKRYSGQGIHPESLIVAATQYQQLQTAWDLLQIGANSDSVDPTDSEINQAAEEYLEAAKDPDRSAWYESPKDLANDTEVRAAINRFVYQYNIARQQGTAQAQVKRSQDMSINYSLFSQTVADFVTPADLAACTDLIRVGRNQK